MRNKTTNWLLGIAIVLAFVLLLVTVAQVTATLRCWSSWGSTDIEYRTKRFSCQVFTKAAGWIPEERFRVAE